MNQRVVLLSAVIPALLGVSTALGQTYAVNWYTIDGGGTSRSENDTYVLRGTIGQPDAGDLSGEEYVIRGGFWASRAQGAAPRTPLPAPYPHNRLRNRYISFDPNPENAGAEVAFKVTLTALTLGSCDAGGNPDVEGWPCRADGDCRACSANENPCWNAGLHCQAGETCDPTGAVCLNDHTVDVDPVVGQHSVGRSWWVGPMNANGVHLLVTEPHREVSAAWPNPVIVADCEIVPVATYEIRAVNVAAELESEGFEISTIALPETGYWADAVGPLGDYCTGNWATCTVDGDCPPGEACIEQWPPPDGFINFHDINAAVFTFSGLPEVTATDVPNIDLHGGTNPSEDPPNYLVNFNDIGLMVQAFSGYPYPYSDPGDCPDVAGW